MADGKPRGRARVTRRRVAAEIDEERGVFMISVAAELAEMPPQTLRMYEARGLIQPQRSPKNTRLYSQDDVERLQRIQELTGEMGMNLAGVERVFELEQELERTRRRAERLEREVDEARKRLEREVERVKRSFKRELVPYQAPGADLVPARDVRGVRIPVSRQARRPRAS